MPPWQQSCARGAIGASTVAARCNDSAKARRPTHSLLAGPPVIGRHRQGARLNSIKTVDVDRRHFGAVRPGAIAETLDPAGLAKQMADRPGVEPVIRQLCRALQQFKIRARREDQHRAQLLAARTIAGDGMVKPAVHLIPDRAALAAAREMRHPVPSRQLTCAQTSKIVARYKIFGSRRQLGDGKSRADSVGPRA